MKFDISPLATGAIIQNTLDILLAKGLISKEEAASVFAKTAGDLRKANVMNAPQFEALANMIEVMANRYAPKSVAVPPSH